MLKTELTDLNTEQIEKYIQDYQADQVPKFTRLWQYYQAKNPTILNRTPGDPDNRTPFGYGRKIVTTFTGYGYRPGYINYRDTDQSDDAYYQSMLEIFKENKEPIKTERSGRNTGIFGLAYELHYIDNQFDNNLTAKAVPRFFNVDPREIILLYDMSPEPKKIIGIRYYRVTDKRYNVELYTKDIVRFYIRENNDKGEWVYTLKSEGTNFYRDVPITAYYMGDDELGIIEPVAPIIDDFDIINSDSMIEFSRFANAYLRVVGGSIGDPTGQNPKLLKQMLAQLKKSRVFDRLKAPDDVTFLTKDIPKDFVEYMNKNLKEQIHAQSHVPDFSSDKFSGQLSGAAIERMLFDFENVVSSAEADFDLGLYDRMRLITRILEPTRGITGEPTDIQISHRRNVPVDELDAANVATAFRNAGISMRSVVENIPNDIIPDDEEEMARQEAERAMMTPPDLEDNDGTDRTSSRQPRPDIS